jgi:hypothetical protein
MEESSYLSRAFSDQGVRLRLRKEPRSIASYVVNFYDCKCKHLTDIMQLT